MNAPELIRVLEWIYVTQSIAGIGLSVYAVWDAYQDMAAALGTDHERLKRLIVWQAYALAGALGILHALLLYLGVLALQGPLPPTPRQAASLHIVEAFVVAQFAAISLQALVVHLRHRVRDSRDEGGQ